MTRSSAKLRVQEADGAFVRLRRRVGVVRAEWVVLVGERVTCFLRAQRGQRVLRLTGALLLLVVAIGGVFMNRRYGLSVAVIAIAVAPLVAVALIALARPQMGPLYVLIAVAMFVTSAFSLKAIAPAIAYAVADILPSNSRSIRVNEL